MKTIMKGLLFSFLMTVFTVGMVAQSSDGRQRRAPEEIAARQTKRMVERLELNAEQKAKVEELNLRYAQKAQERIDEIRKKRETAREQNKEAKKPRKENKGKMAVAREWRESRQKEIQARREAKDLELKVILTPEQYDKWQELTQRRDSDRRNRRGK